MTWHADAEMLRSYAQGALPAAHAASVEAHLMKCDDCRMAIAAVSDLTRLGRNREALVNRLDEHVGPNVEWVLTKLGISESRARLVMVTPAARAPWLLGLVAVLAMVSLMAASSRADQRDAVFVLFLVLAPMLPVVGVAAAFGAVGDPARELTAALPTPAFELLLVRSLAVVAVTTGVSAVAAIPFPGGWEAAAWLLPALGLTAASLALSTWISANRAAGVLSALWLLAAFSSWRANRLNADVLDGFVALRPGGQAAFAALGVAGAVAFYVRRNELDRRRLV